MRRRLPLPSTESLHPRAEALDRASAEALVRLLHEEDRVAVEAARKAAPATARAARRIARALLAGGRLIYAGAGTSGRLAVLDASELPPTFGASPSQVIAVLAGGRAALTQAIEGAEDDPAAAAVELRRRRLSSRDVVCAVSASGTTPFALGALEAARQAGATSILVCCAKPASRGLADLVILADTGPELVAGSTRLKAGTATKLVLNALSTTAMILLGKVYRGRMVDLQPRNAKLRARAERILVDLLALDGSAAAELAARAGHRPTVAMLMKTRSVSRAVAERMLRQKPLRDWLR